MMWAIAAIPIIPAAIRVVATIPGKRPIPPKATDREPLIQEGMVSIQILRRLAAIREAEISV